MGLTNTQYDAIMRGYEERRAAARRAREERVAAAQRAVPALAGLEQRIVEASAEAVRRQLDGADTREARQTLTDLRAERGRLLEAAGIDPASLEIRYTCPDCRDTGYIGSEKCHCFRQEIRNVLYAQARIAPALDAENFDTFSLDLYDDEAVHPQSGITARENMRMVLDICRRYAREFPEKHGNLLLMGETGTGKTFLAKSIARAVLGQYQGVVYLSAHELFELLSPFRRAENGERDYAAQDELLDTDLLVIDDLGTEFNNSMTSSLLFYCLNERMLRGKGTLITTNLKMNQLRDVYSERISSRLGSEYETCYLFGEDLRRKVRKH